MPFKIVRTQTVIERMDEVEKTASKKLRKINKTLGLLSNDPHHPGLHTHKRGEESPTGQAVWQSYVENNTPSAWRVFWYY